MMRRSFPFRTAIATLALSMAAICGAAFVAGPVAGAAIQQSAHISRAGFVIRGHLAIHRGLSGKRRDDVIHGADTQQSCHR